MEGAERLARAMAITKLDDDGPEFEAVIAKRDELLALV
jgi:hypothetical protein